MCDSINALLAKVGRTYTVISEISKVSNDAMSVICTATNQIAQYSAISKHVLTQFDAAEETLLGGIRAAKADGMDAESIRHIIREQLGLEQVPQVANQRICDVFEEVVSDPTKTVSQNVEQTLKTRTPNSRPPSASPEKVSKLCEKCSELEGGEIKKMLNLSRALVRALEKQQKAAK